MPSNTLTDRELTLTRIIDATPGKLYLAWTEPDLIVKWFTPAPWTIAAAETDVRTGGSNVIVMRSPEGQELPQSRHLPRSGSERQARRHRRVHVRLRSIGEAV